MLRAPLSRRQFVQSSILAGLALRTPTWAQTSSREQGWVLIGDSTGQGIYRARWNASTGELGAAELAIATPKPTYLALHPHMPVLYACNEADGPAAAVSAFHVDRTSANLTLLGTQPTQGGAPCFASIDGTGHLLFAANYSGGSLAAFRLDANGVPAPASNVFKCAEGSTCGPSGPVKDRQGSAHLHCAVVSPDNRYVLACDLGDDAILVFPIQPSDKNPLGTPVRVATRAGAGPRHLAFHPNGRWLYCINELDCTVALYTWHSTGAGPQVVPVPQAIVGVRPANAPAGSTGAEIRLTRNGRFAYTSTRFCDVLTVFSVEEHTGQLTQLQQLPCGGKIPRFFALDPSERWLVCANQDSDNISVFARDTQTGHLTPGKSFPATNPECLLWL